MHSGFLVNNWDWEVTAFVTHWVNELHCLCKLRYGLECREYSAGLRSQELAGWDSRLWWRSQWNLRALPRPPFIQLPRAAAACGQCLIWHAVWPRCVLFLRAKNQMGELNIGKAELCGENKAQDIASPERVKWENIVSQTQSKKTRRDRGWTGRWGLKGISERV